MSDENKIDTAAQETAQENALEACKAETEQWKNKFARLTADFDNFKRRNDLDRARWKSLAQEEIIFKLLPVIDDCERAEAEFGRHAQQESVQSLAAGLNLIVASLRKVFADLGITEITQVKTFDPELHEAVMHVESADHQSGEIVQVLQKGYLFNGALLRPAKVSVAK